MGDEEKLQESRRTVLVALAANAIILLAKAIGGVLSGSSALLAEAAHSVADTANQGFLLASLQRSTRPPDDEHPFGYGQERFLWAFVAAIGIFVAGAGFSLYQGLEAILVGQEESSFPIAYVVLVVAVLAEGTSLIRAVRQTKAEADAGGRSMRHYLRGSRDPTTKTVVFEDSAAVTGNVVAIAGVALHQLTDKAAFEGIAALVVAAMLVLAAFLLARDASSLLVGRAATPEEREQILEVLCASEGIDEVLQLLTMALSPDRILVAARVDLTEGIDSERIEELSSEIDRAIHDKVPAVSEVFLDATDRRRFEASAGTSIGV